MIFLWCFPEARQVSQGLFFLALVPGNPPPRVIVGFWHPVPSDNSPFLGIGNGRLTSRVSLREYLPLSAVVLRGLSILAISLDTQHCVSGFSSRMKDVPGRFRGADSLQRTSGTANGLSSPEVFLCQLPSNSPEAPKPLLLWLDPLPTRPFP